MKAHIQRIYTDILENRANLPITFTLDGAPHAGIADSVFPLIRTRQSMDLPDGLEEHIFEQSASENLTICARVAYDKKYGALDWTVTFKNEGTGNSPVISDVHAAWIGIPGKHPVVKGILGDHENNYAPYARDLGEEDVHFLSDLGRPTHVYFPYFNLEMDEGGCLIALGWGGTWEASFQYSMGNVCFSGSGTNGLKTYLLPGESVRTPRMLFLPYEGRDEDRAMNLWRRYYVDRILPHENNKPIQPFSTTCLCNDTGLPNSDGSISERCYTWRPSLTKMLREDVRMDFRWVDAGWYNDPDGRTVPEDWWGTVGTWYPDPDKWPGNTFKESTNFARANGMRTLLWFEPERVTNIQSLVNNWGYREEWALKDPQGRAYANNIGDPDCLNWTTNRILTALEMTGVDMYREDNNFNARPCWAALDTENRAGITENKAVVAHYELWDRIIRYFKGRGGCPFVDSCASGGGRNDLESMLRGVPLLRSDADRTTTSLRLSMSHGFNRWIPFSGALCAEQTEQLDPNGHRDKYVFRASYLAALNMNAQWTKNPDTDFALLRWGLDEWRRVSPYLLKDFYSLTPWHSEQDRTGWTAFLYMDGHEGVLLAFRMEDCEEESVDLTVSAWTDADTHTLTDADTGEEITVRGKSFRISRPEKRSSALYFIK